MIPSISLKNHRLLPLLLLTVTVSLLFASIPLVQGRAFPSPRVEVGATTFVSAGSLTTTTISIHQVSPIDVFDISVQADTNAIDPLSIALGSLLPSPFELTNCVDGVGIGCTIADGPGIAHEVAVSGTGAPSTVANGVLFTVTWMAHDSVNSVIALSCTLVGRGGAQLLGVSFVNGVYSPTGLLPASALPNYRISAATTSISIPAGTSASDMITISAINGFGQDVALTVSTSDHSVVATLNPAGVTCNCQATAFSSVTISTGLHGTFTVVVTGFSPAPARIVNSVTITVTA